MECYIEKKFANLLKSKDMVVAPYKSNMKAIFPREDIPSIMRDSNFRIKDDNCTYALYCPKNIGRNMMGITEDTKIIINLNDSDTYKTKFKTTTNPSEISEILDDEFIKFKDFVSELPIVSNSDD